MRTVITWMPYQAAVHCAGDAAQQRGLPVTEARLVRRAAIRALREGRSVGWAINVASRTARQLAAQSASGRGPSPRGAT